MKTNDPRSDLSTAIVLPWAAVSTKIQDKYSIEDQLRLEREWCKKHGATMLEPLVVRGFSRDYWTLADVVAAAAHDKDMEAFAKLQQHIRRNDFTVFLCFDADRFGRTQSLIHEVLGRITRDCSALVYTLFDGVWMDKDNAPMIGTMKAYKAQADIAKLREYHATGMDNRARDGKSTSSQMPLFHRRIRDERGKEAAIVVNEDLRALWTDIAVLILRGVTWGKMEQALFTEFGHGEDGKPYRPYTVHEWVTNPSWWGHATINSEYRRRRNRGVAPWVWDENVPPPPGIVVYRNRRPAVYSGEWVELGEQVKQQLWNWHKLHGRATHTNTYRFHGLFVCDICGYTLTMTSNLGRRYLRCPLSSDRRLRARGGTCDQMGYINDGEMQLYFHNELERKVAGLPTTLFEEVAETESAERRIEEEKRRITKNESRIDAWQFELADATEHARERYRINIANASQEIEQSLQVIESLQSQVAFTAERKRAQVDNIKLYVEKGGASWLWTQSDTFIHQFLVGILGNNQLTVRDRKITGVIPIDSRQMLTRRERGLS